MTQMKTPASLWRLLNRKVPDNPRGFRDPSKQLTAHGESGSPSHCLAPMGMLKLTCEDEKHVTCDSLSTCVIP